jgi:FkbM family methyltransferase
MAFEPQPHLARRIADMSLENVAVVQAALMDRQGTQILKIPPMVEWGLATVGTPARFEPVDEYHVAAYTLDDYLDCKVGLLKIDVEGAELMVLQGGRRILERDRPDILLEYWPENTAQLGYDVSQIDEFLRGVGYRSFERVEPWDLWVTWR